MSSAKLSRVEFSSDWIWFILEYLGLIWSSLVWHTFLTKLNMLFLYYMVLKSLIADTRSMSRLYVQFLCSGSKLRLNAQVLCAGKNCSSSVFRLNAQSQCSGSISKFFFCSKKWLRLNVKAQCLVLMCLIYLAYFR